MPYNYLNSPLGLMTFINDDAIYNAISSLVRDSQTTYLVRNNAITSEGTTFFNALDASKLFLTCMSKSSMEIDAAAESATRAYFPSTYNTLEDFAALDGIYEIYNNPDRAIKMISNGASSAPSQRMVLNGTAYDVFTGYNNFYGIGYNWGSAKITQFEYLFTIFNSNYTRHRAVQIQATYDSNRLTITAYGVGYINSYIDTVYAFYSGSNPDPRPPVEPTDPYLPPDGPDEPSEPGGGEGDRDDVDVPVPIPGLPPISAADTGFVTLFNPSSAQIKSLANYMWSSGFDIATFKNIVANPMECILGLSIIPFTPSHAGQGSVKVGNIDTQLFFPIVDNQFVEIDCGTIQVAEYWGSYLDYSPYTKISLYLPYIGIVPLDIDEVQGKSLTVKYHVDVLSGACIAYLLCGTSVLYSYIGQCSCNVPITSNDFTNTVNGVLGIAGNIGSLVALGGSSAPMATGTAIKTAASMASNAINMLKPNVQKSGAMAGTGGLMGTQYPYIIKQRPRQSVPANQNTFKGYPSNIAVKLGDLSGYTEVDEVHLDGIPATDAEMNEILQLLSEGVYI